MPIAQYSQAEGSVAINRLSIADQVFDRMRNDIFSGKFKPGERLKELALASEFGVSQSSVRAALQLLSQEGLVLRKPNCGTCITNFTPEEMVERVKVRIVLESLAATEAKRRLDAGSLALLREMAADIDTAVKSTKMERAELSRRDFEFHKALWKISENETLEKILANLCAPLFVFVALKMLPYGERYVERINRHLTIVESLEHSSAEELKETIRAHILSVGYPFLSDSIDWGT